MGTQRRAGRSGGQGRRVSADPIVEPAHYKHPSGIEPIQITKYESFLRGNIIKYVMRAPYKGAELQDLRKAQRYLEWEIERIENAEGIST